MKGIIIELDYSRGVMHLADFGKKLRSLWHKRRKVREFVWKGFRKNVISYYSSTFTINPQPRRLRLRSTASCFVTFWLLGYFSSWEPHFAYVIDTHYVWAACGEASSVLFWPRLSDWVDRYGLLRVVACLSATKKEILLYLLLLTLDRNILFILLYQKHFSLP